LGAVGGQLPCQSIVRTFQIAMCCCALAWSKIGLFSFVTTMGMGILSQMVQLVGNVWYNQKLSAVVELRHEWPGKGEDVGGDEPEGREQRARDQAGWMDVYQRFLLNVLRCFFCEQTLSITIDTCLFLTCFLSLHCVLSSSRFHPGCSHGGRRALGRRL